MVVAAGDMMIHLFALLLLDMELLGGMTALALDADVTVSVRDKNGSTTGSTGTNTSASSMILTNGSPLHTKTIDTE
ncbi:hypothetical protein PM082_021264 [Marasmius tenuissimus]|nr:hypothetical protein PM082_021264 [Marasmius tenuissimus]